MFKSPPPISIGGVLFLIHNLIKMKKEDIARKIISIYKRLLEEGKGMNHKDFIFLLSKNNAERGICYLCYTKLKISIYDKKYMKKYVDTMVTYGTYWCLPPYLTRNKRQAVESIRKRIKILKTWL